MKFDYFNFAKQLSKNSSVQVFLINSKLDLVKYLKKNLGLNEIVIGMGAGTISNWIRDLPKLLIK